MLLLRITLWYLKKLKTEQHHWRVLEFLKIHSVLVEYIIIKLNFKVFSGDLDWKSESLKLNSDSDHLFDLG